MQTRKAKWYVDCEEIGVDLKYFSYQCCTEEILYPKQPEGVQTKADWHAMCDDPDDCECPEHDRE